MLNNYIDNVRSNDLLEKCNESSCILLPQTRVLGLSTSWLYSVILLKHRLKAGLLF